MARREPTPKGERRAAVHGASPSNLFPYGAGSPDYIEDRFKGIPIPGGPLVDILGLMPPGSGKGSVEGIFNELNNPPVEMPQGDTSLFAQQFANAGTVMNDAGRDVPLGHQEKPMAKQVSTPKGDKVAPPTDPISMLIDALGDVFSGATPSPMMGGGTTTQQKDMFTEWPSEMYSGIADPQFDAQQNDPNMSAIATALDPNAWAASQQPVQPPARAQARPPMPTPSPVRQAAPPLPEMNPAFHADPNDMRTIGDMLRMMFDPNPGVPPMPQPAPGIRGGI